MSKFQDEVSGMSDEQIKSEIEKRRNTMKQMKEAGVKHRTDPKYHELFVELSTLTLELRFRLGSTSRSQKMQVR